MIITATAKRYAKALFDLAAEKDYVDEIHGEFKSFLSLIDQNPDLKLLLKLPNDKQREQALADLFKKQFSELFFHFLLLVLRNKRHDLLRQICDDLEVRIDASNHRIRAVAMTAIPLTEQKLRELNREIASYLKTDVRLENEVNPSIIGGIVLSVDGQVFNASLFEQFKKLKQHLIKNQK